MYESDVWYFLSPFLYAVGIDNYKVDLAFEAELHFLSTPKKLFCTLTVQCVADLMLVGTISSIKAIPILYDWWPKVRNSLTIIFPMCCNSFRIYQILLDFIWHVLASCQTWHPRVEQITIWRSWPQSVDHNLHSSGLVTWSLGLGNAW